MFRIVLSFIIDHKVRKSTGPYSKLIIFRKFPIFIKLK
jgi:hypothetical protein